MSASSARKGIPSGLAAALVLSILSSAVRGGDRPKREGTEDDGEIDVKVASFGPGEPPAFFKELLGRFEPCDDPLCPACHPETAGTAAQQSASPVAVAPPSLSPSAQALVGLTPADTGAVRRVKVLAAQLATEVEAAAGAEQDASARMTLSHIATASLWASRAVEA